MVKIRCGKSWTRKKGFFYPPFFVVTPNLLRQISFFFLCLYLLLCLTHVKGKHIGMFSFLFYSVNPILFQNANLVLNILHKLSFFRNPFVKVFSLHNWQAAQSKKRVQRNTHSLLLLSPLFFLSLSLWGSLSLSLSLFHHLNQLSNQKVMDAQKGFFVFSGRERNSRFASSARTSRGFFLGPQVAKGH